MSLRKQCAIIALLIVAGGIIAQAYSAEITSPRGTETAYAPNLMGFTPQSDNNSALSPTVSTGNVTTRPISGTIRVAVILAQFTDIPANRTLVQIQQDYFGGNHSVAAYYHDVSYGKVTITGNTFGWYTLPNAEATYGKDCVAIDDADCSGQDQSWNIAQDAYKLACKNVNFANYDYYIFVHSGNGEESSGV